LDSVLNQTYAHWECIVVDDGSTDNTREVVELYLKADKRIRYVYQGNKGLSAARNLGLYESQGAYVQFLDSDDLIESKKLAFQVGYLEQHSDVDLVYSAVRFFRTGQPDERRFSMREPDAKWMPESSGSGMKC